MYTGEHKVLIANRGEIAIRIAKACMELNQNFVCVYTDADRESGHVRFAREKGGEDSLFRISSYHDANEIFSVADKCSATAVHPGYGFFAEDFRFARRVAKRNNPLIFIGPSWWIIKDLGDKINTKRLARSLGVPTVPGSDSPIYDELEAVELANSLFSFQREQGLQAPAIMVKASAGGGGMGIEEVTDPDEFRSVYRRIRNYAKRQFNDEGVLIEQRIYGFNHLEVQVVSERSGKNHVHFGTRNCSVQSSGNQKRIEVAPGFASDEIHYIFDAAGVLESITEHSLSMARKVGYDNVGTWEWIVTPRGEPFLMEVNTRIQVENGVSAAIAAINGYYNVDIVREQIRLGLGENIGYSQEDISLGGVAIEYRIIAENSDNNFAPWVGTIKEFNWDDQEWLEVYTQVPTDCAYEIPTEFDPNLALAIVRGDSLEQARQRGVRFLKGLTLDGADRHGRMLESNLSYLIDKTSELLEF
ncbi:biotin carboxylase N-terminal domain-containing protein [Maridesulfovibrio hydrothermalis]|uniref:biotin carboxylase n=1 Tax=Maridesulfovibrio hydrothermalis AM13 = DSM 14728 TaxID=1121451 RepID=L0R639_9BACT|nr:biotin carboxylase N-terminal domain-containing protein [Maridesulfovibrio hydrothermalis]CCO22158.1 Pyruvate carboxylase [Maridesulfovibrio hydrothermalis AM13 = DSM 14728]